MLRNIFKYQFDVSDRNYLEVLTDPNDVIDRLENEYAAFIHASYAVIDYTIKSCDLVVSERNLWLQIPIAFPVRKTFPYVEFFNRR